MPSSSSSNNATNTAAVKRTYAKCRAGCFKAARKWNDAISWLPLTLKMWPTYTRWISLVVACFGMAASASVYSFFAWQTPMRAILNQTETESNLVSTLGNLGMNLAFAAGMLYESFGNQAAAIIGGLLAGVAYFLLWLGTGQWRDQFAGNSWIVDILYFMVGLGGSFTYMAALMPNVENFPHEQRGKVIGLLDASLSLGPTLLSVLYNSAFTNGYTEQGEEDKQNLPGYFLTVAILSVTISVALFFFVGRDKRRSAALSASSNVTIVTETSPVLTHDPSSYTNRANNKNYSHLTGSDKEPGAPQWLTDSQAVVAVGVQSQDFDDSRLNLTADEHHHHAHFGKDGGTADDGGNNGNAAAVIEEKAPSDFSEYPFAELPITGVIFRWNFYFLLVQYVLNACLQLTYQSNIPTYLRSFNMNDQNLLFTVLNTTLQTVSKLLAGIVSDAIAHTGRMPRSIVFVIPYVLQTFFLALSMFYGDNFAVMILTCIFVGVANGVTWCQTPTLIGELFGTKYLGSNWGWSMLLTAGLGFPFSIGFSSIYEAAIIQPNEIYCYGLECFTWSFALLAGASLCTVIMSVGLTQNMMRNAAWRRLEATSSTTHASL